MSKEMENRFWAKSNPPETIMEHTENLLREYHRFSEMYPTFVKKNSGVWKLLRLACVYHDWGKANSKFQNRMQTGKKQVDELQHAVLSIGCLSAEDLAEDFSKQEIRALYSAILFHHDRKDLLTYSNTEITRQLEDMSEDIKRMWEYICANPQSYPFLNQKNIYFNSDLYFENYYYEIFSKDILKPEEWEEAAFYILLKGLLNRIDYAASAHIPVEHPNNFLEKGLEVFMQDLNAERLSGGREKAEWNELQEYMKSHREDNLIVLAQTGFGKTEAGLWWIGNQKGFFTLPLRTAINAIYHRIREKMIKNHKLEDRLGLLHGESLENYLQLYDKQKELQEQSDFELEDYYTKTRQLSLPLTICTLDQLFPFVFRYRGYELKLATMAYSKVVIDEVQMYGPDLTGFLVVGLSMIQKMGGQFAVLTATFPGFIKDLMLEQGLQFKMPEQPFVKEECRHSIEWRQEEINADFILEKYKNNRVLVICNTVKQCQKIYHALQRKMSLSQEVLLHHEVIDRELNLFHAKFIKRDRAIREEAITEFGSLWKKDGTPNDRQGIWITSSIAEASLDIDFDILITELSDMNSLFQRLGRCFRSRIWQADGFNCYVFDGGDKKCSGVGYSIQEEIFEMSKNALRRYFAGSSSILSEKTKMDLVEQTYSTENMKQMAPNYYAEVKRFIKNPSLYLPSEMSAKDSQFYFRNILSETVIPLPVYQQNREEISEIEEKLKLPLDSSKSGKISENEGKESISKEEKIRWREKLMKYTVSVESYLLKGAKVEKRIAVNSYQEIKVVACEYDFLIGLGKIGKEKEGKNGEEEEIW
ncbi:MAG: CRISPR-associated helicase Cas3' [Eubacteriales bacterium]|nr:CRISPR-associated helicase Cas3' [Eubacteriales bacterium]